jgi:hypothetical protein
MTANGKNKMKQIEAALLRVILLSSYNEGPCFPIRLLRVIQFTHSRDDSVEDLVNFFF